MSSATLGQVRRAETAMAVRAIVPIALVVLALAAHVGLESRRSAIADLGVTLESKVVPSAVDLINRIDAEASARFSATTTSTAGITTYSVDQLRTDTPADVTAATDASLAAFASAVSDLRSASEPHASSSELLGHCAVPSCGAAALRTHLASFRAATTSPAAIAALNAVAATIPRTLMASFIDAQAAQLPGRLLQRVGVSYVQLLAGAYLEVTSMMALFHQGQSFAAGSAIEAERLRSLESFVAARAALAYYLSFSDLEFGSVDNDSYGAIVAAARVALENATALVPVDSTPYVDADTVSYTATQLTQLRALTGVAAEVASRDPDMSNSNSRERRGLWVASAVLGVCVIALVLTIAVVAMHIRASRAETTLMAEFGDSARMKQVGKDYAPVLQGLRVDALPEGAPSTELGRIYAEAARLISEVRPFLPQTLFGPLVDDARGGRGGSDGAVSRARGGAAGDQQGGPAGSTKDVNPTTAAAEAAALHAFMRTISNRKAPPTPWYPSAHSVRLDSGVCQTTCTLLTVVPLQRERKGPGGETSTVRRAPAELLAWYNGLLATVVELTNRSGGAVHCVEANGIIVCVWNLSARTNTPVSTALSVARALFAAFPGDEIDVNIVTGPCMVANAKTGRRRNVVIVGAALEFAERVLLLNRIHSSNIVLDFDSFRDLTLEEQAWCRPIALLHTGPASRVVLYSADWVGGEGMPARQRKDYLAAFSLYQMGMLEDSLALFVQYLRTHGADPAAEWLVKSLLAHKLRPVDAMVTNSSVPAADRSTAVSALDELVVFGG